MLERILKLYTMAMAGDVRSPMPHLFGPPGCGKSTVVKQAADILGVRMHTINVSRISPLELEGVQMPTGMGTSDAKLELLTATYWKQLKANDILLLDELLRGFPEVYNGMLDIFTAREVAGFELPPVFIIGASNSTVAYDKALEDRLLHIKAPDIRTDKKARQEQANLIASVLGLLPVMAKSTEMQTLLATEVLPMYDILDGLGKSSAAPATLHGCSVRNLIGQAQLREVRSATLQELLNVNNALAVREGKYQYLYLFDAKNPQLNDAKTKTKLLQLQEQALSKLTEVQARNLDLNLQLIGMEEARKEREITEDDDDIDLDDILS